ncbi:MAG: sigma-70 family RNA polymerase sigma factor [Actinomycetota bacterium]|nr:sigma-70 family RNA polymerase sigma factor [Actinomycetota bacterium]
MDESRQGSCGPRDEVLLADARAGDPRGLAELFRDHWLKGLAIARGRCRQPADAADVCAQAFERIIVAIRNGGGPTTTFDGYLRVTIDRIATLQGVQRARVRLVPDVPDAIYAASPHELADEVLASAMSRLSGNQRQLLWLVEVMGYTASEVAAHTGQSANSAAARIYRARRQLRRQYLRAEPLAAQPAIAG